MADRILTRQEMILLHLLQYIDVPVSRYVMPHAMTQQGIGLAAGMSRAHVSNCMTEMREKGLVDSVYTHPKGTTSRMRAYYLLPSGIERAKEISEHLRKERIRVDDVIRRPGDSRGMSPNVARALEELERARNATAALGAEGDPSKARTAIEHASMAILSLSREVARMPLFETGQVVTTCGIAQAMRDDHSFLLSVRECLDRHCRGDWGDVGDESRRMNDDAIEAERSGEPTDRLFSLYRIGDREIYIITEWDRSATTILFPEEY